MRLHFEYKVIPRDREKAEKVEIGAREAGEMSKYQSPSNQTVKEERKKNNLVECWSPLSFNRKDEEREHGRDCNCNCAHSSLTRIKNWTTSDRSPTPHIP